MKDFLKKSCLIVLIAGLIVGFFAGMEYKKYQIRSILNQTADEINNIFDIFTPEDNTIKEARREPESNLTAKLKQVVDVEVVDKGFTSADFSNGPYDSTINFSFKFINNGFKDVRGVQGVVIFYDIFDNEVYRSSISYDDGVPAQRSVIWKAGISFNQFMDSDVKLKSMDLEDLKYEWVPNTIIYTDGTKE